MLDLLGEGDLGKNERRYLEMAEYSAEHLLGIIQDLLDFSQLENRKLKLNFTRFDLKLVVERSIDLFTTPAEEKGVTLRLDYRSDRRMCRGDRTRIAQIITNLLSNAVKYTPRGKVTVTVELAGDLKLRVRDEGVGIPPEHLESIYDSFRQLEDTLVKDQQRVGLGLAIVKNLVDLMGGAVRVESKPGGGTEFTVTVPEQPAVPADIGIPETVTEEPADLETTEVPAQETRGPTAEPRPPVSGETAGPAAPTVLVVEDERINLLYLQELLRRNGFSVETAGDGATALEAVKNRIPRLVCLDIGLPGMSGLEVIERLKEDERTRDIPVIALTAHAGEDNLALFREAGFEEIVTKPFHERRLLEAIDRVLEPDSR
jgi:two-component system CheB/CheR fusion protein